MKAVVYYAPGDIRVEDLPLPQAGPGELRVKVDACAVCGTDLKSYKHGNPRIKAPLAMGHEFTGLVETIGPGAEGFALGDRVVMATSVSCGQCRYCRMGFRNLCVDLAPMGFTSGPWTTATWSRSRPAFRPNKPLCPNRSPARSTPWASATWAAATWSS
jgi:L-iditol 2-dehydrogenase